MNNGWIKLHRSLAQWQWYDDHNATRLLVHLLLNVNYEDKKWHGITIKAGSLVYSWDSLSKAVGLSVQNCRTSMTKLEKSAEVVRKSTNQYQLVTLVKWEQLQEKDNDANKRLTNDQQAANKRLTTTKEVKEIKKEEKSTHIFDFKSSLIEYGADKKLVDEWMKVRKAKKAVNTETAYNGFIKQVEQSTININEVLKLCVEKSWGGFKADWEEVKQLIKKPERKYKPASNTQYY